VLINQLSGDGKRKVVLFSLFCGALFTAVVGTLGAIFVWEMGHTQQTSADLEMPMWIVYLAVPFGSYLMCFRFLQVAWRFAHGTELPRHDEAHVEGIEDLCPAPAAILVRVAFENASEPTHAGVARLPPDRPPVIAIVRADNEAAEAERLKCDVVLRAPGDLGRLCDVLTRLTR
jgi:C4-dicarboxylate transporter DctQ subunit